MNKSSASITSLHNPLVKRWVKLRENRKYRHQERAAFIEGSHLISELSQPVQALIISEGKTIPPHLNAETIYEVSPSIFEKISGVKSPEGIAAEIALPNNADLSEKTLLLAVEELSDPGNLGTLMRTAIALGFEGLFLTDESVDPYNEKALRAAKGATFKLPIHQGSLTDLKELISKRGFHLYVADLEGTSIEKAPITSPAILMLGNEAQGVSNEMREIGIQVTIPIKNQMESLNVAVAGGILMHHIMQCHGQN